MGQTGSRRAGQAMVGRIGCALLALLAAPQVQAQTIQTEAEGSVSIEQPVGGSFALLASNQALTAVFRPRSPDSIGLSLVPVQTGTFYYSAAIGRRMGRMLSYSADAGAIAVQVQHSVEQRSGQPLAFAAPSPPDDGSQAIIFLINFN